MISIFKVYNKEIFLTKVFIWLRNILMPHFKVIDRFVPKTGLILDYGCGHGFFCNYLKITSPMRKIIGVDIDTKKIAIAKNTICGRQGINFFAMAVFSLTSVHKLDALLIIDVLPYLPYAESRHLLKSFSEKTDLIIIKDQDTKPKWKFCIVKIQEYFATRIAKYTSTTSRKLCFRNSKQISVLMSEFGFNTRTIPLATLWPYPDILYICKKII